MNKDLKLMMFCSGIGILMLIPTFILLDREHVGGFILLIAHIFNIIFCGFLLKRGWGSA